jgi:hypothetical protein
MTPYVADVRRGWVQQFVAALDQHPSPGQTLLWQDVQVMLRAYAVCYHAPCAVLPRLSLS